MPASSTLAETDKALCAMGLYLDLMRCRSGKWAWAATALGDNLEMGPNGALYSRGNGFGNTPEEAMGDLLDKFVKKPKKKSVEDLFG